MVYVIFILREIKLYSNIIPFLDITFYVMQIPAEGQFL